MEVTTVTNRLNNLSNKQFVELFGEIFEHSPRIAQMAVGKKPFISTEEAYEAMREIVMQSSYEDKLALILEHPELGKRIKMSEASVREQNGAGLDSLNPDEFSIFSEANKTYMEKFEFPFIIAVAGKNKHDILSAMKERIHNSKEVEFETALQEIYKIARFRFNAIIDNLATE